MKKRYWFNIVFAVLCLLYVLFYNLIFAKPYNDIQKFRLYAGTAVLIITCLLPFIFFRGKGFDENIPSIVLFSKVFFLYPVAALVILFIPVLNRINLQIILQLCLLFFVFVYYVFSRVAASHISSAQSAEGFARENRSLKQSFNSTVTQLQNRFGDCDEIRALKKQAERFSFIAPCRDQSALRLEDEISKIVLDMGHALSLKNVSDYTEKLKGLLDLRSQIYSN